MALIDNPRGGYRFASGIAPYSSGVAAMAGYEIIHVTLHRPVPWRQGFDRIDAHLGALGRPRQALCAIQLRSPEPLSFDGFGAFNQGYRALLADWDLLVDDANPVARTNVAPVVAPPPEASLYGFAYTVPNADIGATFVVAGAGDVVSQGLGDRTIVRDGETSPDAMAERATHVMGVMAERMASLGVGWTDVSVCNIYTMRTLEPYLTGTVLTPMNGSAIHGVRWHYAQPPIAGLEFEMDVRGVRQELVIDR